MVRVLTVEQAREDFRLAMMRVVRGRADPEEVRRGVSELMTVVYGLHERLRSEHLPEHYRPVYVRALKEDRDGQTARALVDLRGAVQHRGILAFAHEVLLPAEDLASSERLAPGWNWQWLPTSAVANVLPNPARKQTPREAAHVAEQLALYDARLAGQTMLMTFDIVGDLFWRVA